MKPFFLIFFIFIGGCYNMQFVYDTSTPKNDLENNTKIEVVGDQNSIINIILTNKLKNNFSAPKYKLSVLSSKKTKNLVVKTNQTATHIEITYYIKYSLYKMLKDGGECLVVERGITTISDYKVKSEGYSFGSETEKNNVIKKILNSNFKQFLNEVGQNPSCEIEKKS